MVMPESGIILDKKTKVILTNRTKINVASISEAKALIEKATGKKVHVKYVKRFSRGLAEPALENFYDIWIPPYGIKKGHVGLYFVKPKVLFILPSIIKKLKKK